MSTAQENSGHGTDGARPAQKQRNKFPKGNTLGNKFSADNQPVNRPRPRKVVKILDMVTEVPREEISNTIRTIFFDKSNSELEEILKDHTQKAFIQICAKVALNCRNEGRVADFETLLQWAYVKKTEMRIELDDISKMSREEKEAEAARLLQESNADTVNG